MENLTNTQKIELSVLLTDALESNKSLRHQVQAIQETFNNHASLKRSMEWMDFIDHGLKKMKTALDEITDWKELEGTDTQPEG